MSFEEVCLFALLIFGTFIFTITLLALFYPIKERKKLYKIEYKKTLTYHSMIIEAKTPASAVKKFNRKYGRTCEVQNITEIRGEQDV